MTMHQNALSAQEAITAQRVALPLSPVLLETDVLQPLATLTVFHVTQVTIRQKQRQCPA